MIAFMDDLIIDEEAFRTAVQDLQALSTKLQNLRNETEEMLNTLKTGWDTEAGRKFIQSCERNLYKPLDDQKLVLDHISESLNDAVREYASVFSEYDELQNTIKKVQ